MPVSRHGLYVSIFCLVALPNVLVRSQKSEVSVLLPEQPCLAFSPSCVFHLDLFGEVAFLRFCLLARL